jgi:hypothetical protein
MIIVQKLHFDIDSGCPYVIGKGGSKIMYEANKYVIPDTFRRLISRKGDHWSMYIKPYDEGWEYEVSVDDFLLNYPSWHHVFEGLENTFMWTKHDHDIFRATLMWLSEKGGYYVNWSY